MPPLLLRGFEASVDGSRAFKVALEPDRTILVGKNGAGKSMVAEALLTLRTLVTRVLPDLSPFERSFALTFAEGEYAVKRTRKFAENFRASSHAPEGWGSWEVSAGEASGAGLDGLRLPKSASVLGVEIPNAPASVAALRTWLMSVRIVRAGVPREGDRSSTLLKREDGVWIPTNAAHAPSRETLLSMAIVNLPRSALRELNAVGKRLGVWKSVQVQVHSLTASDEYAYATVDDVNLGMVSDGTQRVLEILLAILDRDTSLLILEEPETSLHPGLVMRLLHELDACEAQVLVTTHSPQVVSHFAPKQLRLVERRAARTRVSALGTDQAERLTEYLNEGTLGEYVFQGGLDDA